MSRDKLISVIVPVCNTEQYIERSIYSIINQTYKNMEIICVDDGSTDMSSAILDRLSQKDRRIKVIHKKKEGVSEARNVALLEAKGDYIGFVDSDDYVAPDYYEKLTHILENDIVDIAACSYYIDNAGNITTAQNKKKVPQEIMKIKEFLPYIYERDTYKGVASYLWTRLIRKEIIKGNSNNLEVQFRKEFAGLDDIVFVAELNLRSKNIQYIDVPLYYYFQRDGSIGHDNINQLNTLEWVRAYEWILDEYKKHDINKDILDIIWRMYIYRCGKLLETAIEIQDIDKVHILQRKIKKGFITYARTNMEHLDRIQWILQLLLYNQ